MMHKLLIGWPLLRFMPETICRSCGKDLQVGSAKCPLCELELTMVCPACGYVSDSKVHADCLAALALVN